MIIWFFKRLLTVIPIIIGITFVSFLLLHILPGDPVHNMVGERAEADVIEHLKRQIGSDKPFLYQYWGYISLLAQGNLGKSLYSNKDVASEISQKMPNTFILTLSALLLAVPIGVTAGFISAISKNAILVKIIDQLSMWAVSVPVFCSGIFLMMLLSLYLKLLPPSGSGEIRFLILPAFTLAIPASATLARITKTTIADIFKMPYISTAIAKGLSIRRMYLIHVLKNALIPIVTIIGLDFGSYLNGAVVTETIFGWDGIGRLTMEGIIKRDYPVILGCVTVGAITFVIVNTLTDFLYYLCDPRIRHKKG